MGEPIDIVIADDHPVFREGMRQVIEKEPRIRIVGEGQNGEEAFRLIMDKKPHVAVIDFQMPLMTGLDVVRHLDVTRSSTKVVLLTMLDDRKIFLEAMDLGVTGYILKDSAVSEILQAVKAVADGRLFISPSLAGFLLKKRSESRHASPLFKELTPTEVRILKLIADLKSNQEIAGELFISKRTVENHRVNVARKLGLKKSHALLKFALENRENL